MKKILLILLLAFSATSFANDNVQNRAGIYYDLDTDAPYTGIYNGTYTRKGSEFWSRVYRYKIEFRNGIRNGLTTVYSELIGSNPKPSYKLSEIQFNNGKVKSSKRYNEDGRLQATAIYKNGVVKVFHQQTGKLMSRSSYIEFPNANQSMATNKIYRIMHGENFGLNGEFVDYFPNGKIHHMKTYKNWVKHGPFITRYKNGQLFMKGDYVDGKMNGRYEVYCKDGRIDVDQTYLANEVVETRIDKGSNFCFE